VAERLVHYTHLVGCENSIASVDCGFGTFACRIQVDPKIV